MTCDSGQSEQPGSEGNGRVIIRIRGELYYAMPECCLAALRQRDVDYDTLLHILGDINLGCRCVMTVADQGSFSVLVKANGAHETVHLEVSIICAFFECPQQTKFMFRGIRQHVEGMCSVKASWNVPSMKNTSLL